MRTNSKRINVYYFYAYFLLLILTYEYGNAFCVPENEVQSNGFTWSTFEPIPYKPVEIDISIMRKSFERIENFRSKANEEYDKLIKECNALSEKLGPVNAKWFDNYIKNEYERIDQMIEMDPSYASKIIRDITDEIRSNPEIRYRLDSYNDYISKFKDNEYLYKNGRVNSFTWSAWLYDNQYNYKPKYDNSYNLVGYIPCDVTSLYDSINWAEVEYFIGSKGVEYIDNLWEVYFSDYNHKLSLYQELDTIEIQIRMLEELAKGEITQQERENILSSVSILKSLILDAQGKPSIEVISAYFRNLMKGK